MYPQLPPLAITLFLYVDSSGSLGALIHGATFSLLNLPLLISDTSNAEVLFTISSTVLAALIALSICYWGVVIQKGLRYQGLTYVRFVAAANAIVLLALSFAAVYLWQTFGVHSFALRTSLIWFNAALYLAFLLVLFPYLGEVP